MRLFIGNGTMQHRDFQFRCPKTRRQRHFVVRAGHQISENLDYTPEEAAAFERQLNAAGAVRVPDIRSINGPYALVYSLDSAKPIKQDAMDDARAKDIDVRQSIAAEVTEQSGLAMFATVQRHTPRNLVGTTLELEQMEAVGDDVVKSGVNFEASVSRKAGNKRTERRRAA